ncbi:MAG: hypothetical protein WC342_10545 [Methanoregula sp.]|jgi:hypothetical protein
MVIPDLFIIAWRGLRLLNDGDTIPGIYYTREWIMIIAIGYSEVSVPGSGSICPVPARIKSHSFFIYHTAEYLLRIFVEEDFIKKYGIG